MVSFILGAKQGERERERAHMTASVVYQLAKMVASNMIEWCESGSQK